MNITANLKRVRQQMMKVHVNCLILTASTDLTHIIGFDGISMERPILLILTQENAFFIAAQFEISGLSEEIQKEIKCIGWMENESPYEKVQKALISLNGRCAIGNRMPAEIFYHLQNTFKNVEWHLGDEIMVPLRARKTNDEYQFLKTAQVKAGNAFKKVMSEGLEGKTEKQIAHRLQKCMEAEGLNCNSYPLVAAGKNSAIPHHMSDETIIQKNDAVIIDFGGSFEGYYSDITRTVVVGKEPLGFSEIYEVVRQANESALNSAKPGMSAQDLDRTARKVIELAGYGKYFTHRLGHGIGRDVHEHPYIVRGNEKKLEEGNTFSNEPGIYISGRFGIRLEDVLILRSVGAECLTELPHDYMVVD